MDQQIHMVGNAHLDPVWLWQWPEGLQALRATFRSALDRMAETPGFVFAAAQAAVYEWLDRCEPEMLAEIRGRVQEGRWVITGGWWMQPDCNLPSGEAFARQSLYAQRFFQEKLGAMARVGYNVDSFGHNAMLPQILKLSGLDYYVMMRPGPHEKPDLPGPLFIWEAPDGTQMLTYQIPESYNSGAFGPELADKVERTAGLLSERLPLLMCYYGVGNHGGGPTRENLAMIETLAARTDGPRVLFSDPWNYFQAVEAAGLDLPVVKDDLQHHASGCYAAHSAIKADNRRAEHSLATAEKLAVAACVLCGLPYPQADLTRAWQAVLFNQFHDILAGTSIREAYDDARHLHGLAFQMADEVKTFSQQRLTSRIDLTQEGQPIVVCNPLGHVRTGLVEVEVDGAEYALYDDRGHAVPLQRTTPSACILGDWRRPVAFMAEVPPLGYTTYWLRSRAPEPLPTDLHATADSLENEHLAARFDPATGTISSLLLKATGWEACSGPAAVPVVINDWSDTWSHGVFRYDEELGRFGEARLELVEQGPVRATLRATSTWGASTVIQEFSLLAGQPYLDVRVTVDWREQLKLLKLEFPVNVTAPQATYEIQYGAFARPANGEEEPGLHWFDVTGAAGADTCGLAILNDAKYSYDVLDSRMRLTVLRAAVYAHHEPKVLQPDTERYHYLDQGLQEFRYRLLPHGGSWQQAAAPQVGLDLNVPLIGLLESNHAGNLAATASLLSLSAPNVLLSAVKQAEEGGEIILRAYEAHGQATECEFTWVPTVTNWRAAFRPYEVKTFALTECSGVTEVDLLERPR